LGWNGILKENIQKKKTTTTVNSCRNAQIMTTKFITFSNSIGEKIVIKKPAKSQLKNEWLVTHFNFDLNFEFTEEKRHANQ
jgi:polysaccharide pyruvyl transferase WcaK-like protein